jgi:hypothetical protein
MGGGAAAGGGYRGVSVAFELGVLSSPGVDHILPNSQRATIAPRVR